MQFFDDETKLFYLQLLVFNLAILILDLAVRNVEVWLQLFELGHANDIFTDLNDLKLKLFIFNRSLAQLVAKLFYLNLVLLDQLLLLLRFDFELSFTFLERVDLD